VAQLSESWLRKKHSIFQYKFSFIEDFFNEFNNQDNGYHPIIYLESLQKSKSNKARRMIDCPANILIILNLQTKQTSKK